MVNNQRSTTGLSLVEITLGIHKAYVIEPKTRTMITTAEREAQFKKSFNYDGIEILE